ncbi:MAG: DMT family transporter, partial [Sporomusa sp.]
LTVDWQLILWPGWASVIYSGIFPLCIANCLWIWGTAKAGSTTASLYNNLSPVFAVAAGYFFLNETFSWLQFTGAVVILTGLYVAKTRSARMTTDKCKQNG